MRLDLTDGNTLEIEIKRKKIKNMILRVYPDGNVRISVPKQVGDGEVHRFVQQKKAWIEKHLENTAGQSDDNVIRLLGEELERVELPAEKNRVYVSQGRIYICYNGRTTAEVVVANWWRSNAGHYFNKSVDRWMERLSGVIPARPRIRVRRMKSKWGSCTCKKGDIRLNYYLMCAPYECVEYVVLHELAHLLHPDHGAGFKAFMGKYMPDWKARRKLLNSQPIEYGKY